MKALQLIIIALVLTGCAHRVRILSAQAVSMTKKHAPSNKKVKETGDVKGEFCMDSSQSGTFGLLDEVTKKTQKENKIDMIMDATFYASGSCVEVEGTGAVLARK